MSAKQKAPLKPLSKGHDKFVDGMVHHGDEKKASIDAGFCPIGYRNLLKNPRILEEIDRRKKNVQKEQDLLTAKKKIVTVDALDTALMAVVRVDVKKIPQLGPSKVRAIELGYERVGVLVDGTFIPDSPVQTAGVPAVDEHPRIFRIGEARILTHTIETRTQQEYLHREVAAPRPPAAIAAPQAAPPVVDAAAEAYRY